MRYYEVLPEIFLGELNMEGHVWPYLVTSVLKGESYQEASEHLSPTDLSLVANTLGIVTFYCLL